MKLLTKRWDADLAGLVAGARADVLVVSPFVTEAAFTVFRPLRDRKVRCRLITRLNKADFWKRVSRIDVLRQLLGLGVEIRALKGLHAKAYLFDDAGVVTSANLTGAGVGHNYEMGLSFKRSECAEPFEEAERLWASLKVDLTDARLAAVAAAVEEFRNRQPADPTDLPAELTDEGEVPEAAATEDVVYEIGLLPGIDDGIISIALADLRRAHDQVDTGGRVDILEEELYWSDHRSITLDSFLWLAGWCNTDPVKKKTARKRARDLAEEMFGYVPPETLDTGGRRYRLKDYRYGRRVPFADELVAMHVDLMAARAASSGHAS